MEEEVISRKLSLHCCWQNHLDLNSQNLLSYDQGVRERMFHSRDSDEVRYEKQMEFRSHVRDIQERQMMEPKKKISPEE